MPFVDISEDGEFETAVRQSSNLGRAKQCRRCDSTGVVSGLEGAGEICPQCKGSGAAPRPQDRIRASWGVR